MIFTVSFNPAIEVIMRLPQLRVGANNIAYEEDIRIGGKPLNTSMLLNQLKVDSIALGFVGGVVGKNLEQNIALLPHVHSEFMKAHGDSSIQVKILDAGKTEVSGKGVQVTEKNKETLLTVLDYLKQDDMVLFSDEMADGIDNDYVLELVEKVEQKDAKIIMNGINDGLLSSLKNKIFLLTQTEEDLIEFFNKKYVTDHEVYAFGKVLAEKAQQVIITLGKRGVFYFKNKTIYRIQPSKNGVVDENKVETAFVAGYISAQNMQLERENAFAYAYSCATALGLTPDSVDAKEIAEIFRTIRVQKIQ